MPHNALKITGGVVVNETPALNEAGISQTQLVRLKPDPQGLTLVEKLGGWAKFYATQITSVVRAIWGWEDTNANKWFAYGTTSNSASSLVGINCITDGTGRTTASGTIYPITPQFYNSLAPVNFQTTAGSAIVTVTDNLYFNGYSYQSVFITTPVSVGGLILFGQYQIASVVPANNKQYNIIATNLLGQPIASTYSTVASPVTVTGCTYAGGSPPTLTYTYAALGSAPFLSGENVNVTGISPLLWNGSYIVQSSTTTQTVVICPSGYTGAYSSGGTLTNYGSTAQIQAANVYPSDVITVTLPDHGKVVGSTYTVLNQLNVNATEVVPIYGDYTVSSVSNSYTFGINVPNVENVVTNTVYQGGGVITGGSSTTTAVTLTVGPPSFDPFEVSVTGGSSSTTVVTLNVSTSPNNQIALNVGSTVYVSGVNPPSWNGSFVVTAATTTYIQYSLSGSALSWVSGGTIQNTTFNIGDTINVADVTPTAWNGNFVVTNSTPTTVTYALSGSALSWVSGGNVSNIGGNVALVYITQFSAFQASRVYASNWSLDNWGQILLASPLSFSPISYSTYNIIYNPIMTWDPVLNPGGQPVVIVNGPTAMNGFFVAMPQRQIVAWGTTFAGIIDPLLIRWCDVSNYNVWIAQTTNQAGSYRLSTGSAIVGAIQAQQQGFLWTDIGLWSMQYIGTPYVYSFNQLGQGCGLIARRAMGVLGGIVYWMGRSQFFTLSGDGVTPLLCPIWDVVFQNLDLANLAKITCAANSLFNEVTWYYPVIGGNGENSAYVRVNTVLNAWEFGTLGRTAWIDNSVLGPPIGYDPVNQYIYQHEISPDADGAAMSSSFTTGYFAIAEGDQKAFLDQVWPDFKWGYYNQSQLASISITFNACDYPGQTPTTYGPFTVTQASTWFSPRIRARLISITVSSSDVGTWWRMGNLRYRVQADGKF